MSGPIGDQGSVTKVLIANRGEIAVRIARAARDAGIVSVAVYADSDRNAPHVELADEAFALGGDTPAETYLSVDKLLEIATRAKADAVHPGYGFLSENADFAAAVQDAGLTWIGPSPQAIRALGDKVTARHIAHKVGAPLVPGTTEPVRSAEDIVAFAESHGLPVAIKAAFGGGGRGLKVARTLAEIPELLDSATREAVAAFGNGECFVERYVDNPRHVEAQVLADQHGNVIVVGTRDCSLQRRHQKLVEEAPAPFLSDHQRTVIHESAKAICVEAGYSGAGTVEYLVGRDGTISFLEVNTRLQVEHPVSEETTGIDLVAEMFRIARGEKLRFDQDPEPRGHAIEFRINGEDPGRGFLPAPGKVTKLVFPTGPGIRVDSGIRTGSMVGGQFDSMLAKLIVTGSDRANALARSRRALDEMVMQGLATVLPFHRAIVRDPAFVGDGNSFAVHTRWIETEFDNQIEAFSAPAPTDAEEQYRDITVEVDGRRLEVRVPQSLFASQPGARRTKPPTRRQRSNKSPVASGDAVIAPMQGVIIKVAVTEGQRVEAGDLLVMLEAMKMENPVVAHKAGTVTGLSAQVGTTVTQGATLLKLTD